MVSRAKRRGAGLTAMLVIVALLAAIALGFFMYLHNMDMPGPRAFLLSHPRPSVVETFLTFAPGETRVLVSGDLLLEDPRWMSRSILDWCENQGLLRIPSVPELRNVEADLTDI